jgi:hypothetical protein
VAEEAQELVVQNTAQPIVVEIEVATTDEIADSIIVSGPASQTVEIDPASD